MSDQISVRSCGGGFIAVTHGRNGRVRGFGQTQKEARNACRMLASGRNDRGFYDKDHCGPLRRVKNL
jgi:hypothetical protein